MLTKRQKELLRRIVQEYIAEAKAIPSGLLAQDFSLSPATIRNEMSELERQGYIYQLHTSAGRIPSQAGFRFYVNEFVEPLEPSPQTQKGLRHAFDASEFVPAVKNLAKRVAQCSCEAIVIAFNQHDIYYTGLSNLFVKPEFSDSRLVINFTQLMDHLDERIADVFEQISDESTIYLGDENPFGKDLAALLTRYHTSNQNGIMAMIGPIRMSYSQNLGLMNFSLKLIENNAKI